jgi:hypothetical protein
MNLPQDDKQRLIESFLVEASKADILALAQQAIIDHLNASSDHDEKLKEYLLTDLNHWELEDEIDWFKEDEACFIHLSSRDFKLTSTHENTDKSWSKFPVYAYSHGGLALSTTPFSSPWDSGVLGYIKAPSKELATDKIKWLDNLLNGRVQRDILTGDLVEA